MIELFYAPKSRAVRPRWLLEEIGAEYTLKRIDLKSGEHKTSEILLEVNPLGKVPAIRDGRTTLFESGAIIVYLAEKFGRFIPSQGSARRGEFFQWMFLASGELDNAIVKVFLHTLRLPENRRNPDTAKEGQEQFHPIAMVLENRLRQQPYLMGDEFSAVDILLGSLLIFADSLKMMLDYPILQAYIGRLTERPAYKRATVD